MKFTDLQFNPHPNDPSGVQAVHDFPNGYGVSVIRVKNFSYGAHRGLYELAVLKGDRICYDSGITDDVLGHLTPTDIDELLRKVEELPNAKG